MNKRTMEYLEWVKDAPKNGRNPDHINHGVIFKKAQSGDMNAFNYLYENNAYLITEVIKENTRFIDTNLDIQEYIDILTDSLITSIKAFDASLQTPFRSYAKRNLFSQLMEFNKYHKKLTHTCAATTPLSTYDIKIDDDSYPLNTDTINLAQDNFSFVAHSDNIGINNAKDLWGKLQAFINEDEADMIYRYIVNNESQDSIAESYNISRQMVSYKITKAIARLRNTIELANKVYSHLVVNKLPIEDLMFKGDIRDSHKIDFYLRVYNYLYCDGKLPTGSNTYGYLRYRSTLIEEPKTNIKKIRAIRELN